MHGDLKNSEVRLLGLEQVRRLQNVRTGKVGGVSFCTVVNAVATRGWLPVPFPPVTQLDGVPQPVSSAPPCDSIVADGTSEK